MQVENKTAPLTGTVFFVDQGTMAGRSVADPFVIPNGSEESSVTTRSSSSNEEQGSQLRLIQQVQHEEKWFRSVTYWIRRGLITGRFVRLLELWKHAEDSSLSLRMTMKLALLFKHPPRANSRSADCRIYPNAIEIELLVSTTSNFLEYLSIHYHVRFDQDI